MPGRGDGGRRPEATAGRVNRAPTRRVIPAPTGRVIPARTDRRVRFADGPVREPDTAIGERFTYSRPYPSDVARVMAIRRGIPGSRDDAAVLR